MEAGLWVGLAFWVAARARLFPPPIDELVGTNPALTTADPALLALPAALASLLTQNNLLGSKSYISHEF